MKARGTKKRWGRMTAAELAEATREFDHPLAGSRYRRATRIDRERFQSALRAGTSGRRSNGTGLDSKLLKRAAAYANRKHLTMSQLLERALRRELAVED
jgi:hypothetical protein